MLCGARDDVEVHDDRGPVVFRRSVALATGRGSRPCRLPPPEFETLPVTRRGDRNLQARPWSNLPAEALPFRRPAPESRSRPPCPPRNARLVDNHARQRRCPFFSSTSPRERRPRSRESPTTAALPPAQQHTPTRPTRAPDSGRSSPHRPVATRPQKLGRMASTPCSRGARRPQPDCLAKNLHARHREPHRSQPSSLHASPNPSTR